MSNESYIIYCRILILFSTVFSAAGKLSACDIPANISSSSPTTSSITISWNTVPFSSSYIVAYREYGLSNWEFNVAYTNVKTLSVLQPGTQYEVKVQSVCSPDSSEFSPVETVATLIPPPDHIVICIMENKDFDQIVDTSAAPYINSVIIDTATALFFQSFAIEHPSFPNYLDLFSGSNQGITQDTCLAVTFTSENIGSQLFAGGKSFSSYCEDLPAEGYAGCATGLYVKKHNASVYWQGSGINQLPVASNKPFTAFPSPGDYDSLPTLSFVIPNKINDMHDGTIETGDAWLQNNLGNYIEWTKTHNSLFIFTFDENDDSPANQIPTFFSGERVKGGSYYTPMNHFSVLRTIEDMYGLSHAGNADTATTIFGCWKGEDSIATSTENEIRVEEQNTMALFPNPATTETVVSITLNAKEPVTLNAYNLTGSLVFKFCKDNTLLSQGHHLFYFSPRSAGIIQGIYCIRLCTSKEVIQQLLIVE